MLDSFNFCVDGCFVTGKDGKQIIRYNVRR